MQIGIIGLGAMGSRIALRLLHTGHDVTVWNRSPAAMDELVKAGARSASRVADALQGDVALSILFDDAAVRSVLLDAAHPALPAARCIHVCMSTVSLDLARDLTDVHAKLGVRYAAAPILGRPEVIESQGLNILSGGDTAVLDRIETPLNHLGKVWRLGSDPVHAHAAKLAANFMISGALEAMAEAAALLGAHGADTERFLSTMSATLFAAPVYKLYGPLVAGRTPEIPSGLALPLKDNGLFLAAAARTDIRVPLAEAIRANLLRASEAGSAKDDWSTALAQTARG